MAAAAGRAAPGRRVTGFWPQHLQGGAWPDLGAFRPALSAAAPGRNACAVPARPSPKLACFSLKKLTYSVFYKKRMSEANPFAGLKVDKWYKAFVPFGGLMTLIALFHSPDFITQPQLFVFGLGFLVIGLGRWKDQKSRSFEKPATSNTPYVYGTISYWKPGMGMLLVVLGTSGVAVSLSCIFNLGFLCII